MPSGATPSALPFLVERAFLFRESATAAAWSSTVFGNRFRHSRADQDRRHTNSIECAAVPGRALGARRGGARLRGRRRHCRDQRQATAAPSTRGHCVFLVIGRRSGHDVHARRDKVVRRPPTRRHRVDVIDGGGRCSIRDSSTRQARHSPRHRHGHVVHTDAGRFLCGQRRSLAVVANAASGRVLGAAGRTRSSHHRSSSLSASRNANGRRPS
jgi:hypothetical protein